MNAVVEKEPDLPAPVARRGISEAQWRTLKNSLFPGAASESVIMVWDYCAARKLDPLKKPCHIVPMQVKDQNGNYIWRDVVMPGIYEYRTTATRTGLYLGHSIPQYGTEIEFMGVKAPEYCDFTVYRWNVEAKMRGEYPVRLWFSEVVATAYDKKAGLPYVNARWTKAPRQMLTKCTEAAALREAFPDELGGTHTEEEMSGQTIEVENNNRIDPRSDLSNVDWELRDKWVSQITDTLQMDVEEVAIANALQEISAELNKFPELYQTVFDKLAKDGILSKKHFKDWLALAK